MLLIRSLMSETGKDRSTRESPSTDPSLWKYPTPLEYSTTCPIGRLALLASFCSAFAPGRAAPPFVANHSRPAAAMATAPTNVHSALRFMRGLLKGAVRTGLAPFRRLWQRQGLGQPAAGLSAGAGP